VRFAIATPPTASEVIHCEFALGQLGAKQAKFP
jgi:hypothetical protein